MKNRIGEFRPRRELIVTTMCRKFQPKLMLSSLDNGSSKKLTIFSEYVEFVRIRYLRKKASILAETLGTL
jgi:hypothetical protein